MKNITKCFTIYKDFRGSNLEADFLSLTVYIVFVGIRQSEVDDIDIAFLCLVKSFLMKLNLISHSHPFV